MINKYKYDPVSNKILRKSTLSDPVLIVDDNFKPIVQRLPINEDLFIGPEADNIIAALKAQYPEYADEFRKDMVTVWPEYIKYRENKTDTKMLKAYKNILAIRLAAFINTKWQISQLGEG